MSKKRKTVSLDPEVAAYLSAEGRNASEKVNKLVKMDMGEETMNEEILRMRAEMERDKYETAAQKARGHLERYNQIMERLESKQDSKNDYWQAAKDAVTVVDGEIIEGEQYLAHHASNLNMTVEELRTELIERCNDE